MEFLHAFLQRHLKAAWRRRWIGVAAAWAVCLAGWTLVAMMPNQYQAESRLYVASDAILTPLLAGIAVNTSPQGRLDMLQRTLLSRPNMEELISKTDLDLHVTGPDSRDAMVRGLQSSIMLGQQGDNLFTIAYRSTSPRMAQQVVQTLLSIFIEKATGSSHRDMENARRFLEHQLASYEQQLRTAERRRAEFRNKYLGVFTPEGTGASMALDTLHAKIVTLQTHLQDLQLEAKALGQELAGTKPMLVAEDLAGGPGGLSPLAQAEERLRMMQLQYTDDYPGVVALKKQIAAMKSGALSPGGASAAGGRAGKGKAELKAGTRSVPNPVYDQIKVKLVLVNGQISATERQLAQAQGFVKRLETLQRQEPNLVADYENMNRTYAVLRGDYNELMNRLQSANIAEAADTQADKVQIRVVDPPVLPRLPVAPNRLLLVSGVMLVGLGVAFVLPFLLAQLDRSFCVVDDLRILGLPVLGGISMVGVRPLHIRLRVAIPIGFAMLLLIAMYGGLVIRILHTASVI